MSPKPRVDSTMSPLAWAMLLSLSLLWGGSFFFNAIAVQELPTFTPVEGGEKKVDISIRGAENSPTQVQFGGGYSGLDGFFGSFS